MPVSKSGITPVKANGIKILSEKEKNMILSNKKTLPSYFAEHRSGFDHVVVL